MTRKVEGRRQQGMYFSQLAFKDASLALAKLAI